MSIKSLFQGPHRNTAYLLIILTIGWMVLPAMAQEVVDPSSGMRQALKNPWVLFGLMIFGSILSGLKQLGVSKMEGTPMTVGKYLSYAQELFTTIGGNALAFFFLVDSGQLNFVSAVSIGYVLNSASDLLPTGKRSGNL